MKIKNLLLTLSCASVVFGATAQSHHGFYYKPDQEMIDASLESDSKAPKSLTPWFNTTEFVMPMYNDAKTDLVPSTIYEGNKTDLIPRQAKIDANAAKLNGAVMEATFADDGVMWVTAPSTAQFPTAGTAVTAPGTVVFHLVLGSTPHRINDTDNVLSYTGDHAYLSDCNGVNIGICLPEGATVKAYLSTPNINAKNAGGYDSLGDVMRTAAFDFDNVATGKYVEVNSGAPYNSLACIEMTEEHNPKWPDGYCAKYIDVVVYNVKAGDKVGFGGLQTLHPGWTPAVFAGVEEITVDNENSPVEYFNLHGIRVNNPENGLYIRRQGTQVSKVVIK